MSKLYELIRTALPYLRSRRFGISLLALAVAAVIGAMSTTVHAVYINDGGSKSVVYTTRTDADEILRLAGITTTPSDLVLSSGIGSQMGEIKVKRAFPVTVKCDGTEKTVYVTGGVVADVLKKAEVTLGASDIVSVDLQASVSSGDRIAVGRVEYKTVTKKETIPYTTTVKRNSLLQTGYTRTLVAGVNGAKNCEYLQTYIDGELISEDFLSEKVTRKPTNQLTLMGEHSAVSPIKAFSEKYELNANGIPKNYKKKLTGKATGYTARPGAWGASGLPCVVGHVAVDPRIIPYGTKMYIRSTTGAFIYGYAVAADTGEFRHQGRVLVDLFYATYRESALNGLKNIEIYILE